MDIVLQFVSRLESETLDAGDALNDVVVNSGNTAQMIEYELYIDDTFVYRQRADGLIVSKEKDNVRSVISTQVRSEKQNIDQDAEMIFHGACQVI